MTSHRGFRTWSESLLLSLLPAPEREPQIPERFPGNVLSPRAPPHSPLLARRENMFFR